MKIKFKIFTLLMVSLFMMSILFAQTTYKFKIIVNENNNITEISKSKLAKTFLKKTTRWEDGSKIYPVDQISDSATRKEFTRSIHNKKVSSIKAYWQKQIFSGTAVPPVEKKSDKDVLNYIKNNPGSIGYVSSGASVNGVKVISIKN